jgi:L-seryl-tRNA(Ser) seleniumtransferase
MKSKENRNIHDFAHGRDALNPEKQALLRKLPGVDYVIDLWEKNHPHKAMPRPVVVQSIRATLEALRSQILTSAEPLGEALFSDDALLRLTQETADKRMDFNLKRVINATGVVIHTNLGRSLLAEKVADHVARMSSRYTNLEFDLNKGARGSRYSAVEDILCELSGAEAALVVNNNAGAVFLALETLAKGKEVIVSRGELVEIGGSFRIPDVMARSNARLVEVGATNRTHPGDYEGAISSDTALLLKVHTSNYSIVGFTAEVSLPEMVALGAKYHVPVMKDLGSGSFVDFSQYGLIKEPTVQDTVAAGVDVVTFSGDKMLGGPQAGIIVGKRDFVDPIKKNPINRALRIDKMTLAALEATLQLYRDETEALSAIPTLRMLTMPVKDILKKAKRLKNRLKKLEDSRLNVALVTGSSRVGGGSLPLQELPTKCLGVTMKGLSANTLESLMRQATPPVIVRIEEDSVVIDLRTVQDEEIGIIADTFEKILMEV